MSVDVIEDLLQVYRGSVPADVSSSPLAQDVAYSLAAIMARAEEEVSRITAGAQLSSATGLWVDEHLKDRGLRRQEDETDEQAKARARRPPQAVTPTSIVEAVVAIVGVKARLDLGPLTSANNAILRARRPGASGNLLSLQMIADRSSGCSLIANGVDHVFHFTNGETTTDEFNVLIAESPLVELESPAISDTMTSGDEIPKTLFSGGLDNVELIEVPLDGLFIDRHDVGFMDRPFFIGGARGVVIVLIPQSADARQSVVDAVRTKVSAGKIWFVLEYV